MARLYVLVWPLALLATAAIDAAPQPRPSDLEAARSILDSRARGGNDAPVNLFGFSLAGYGSHREVTVGAGITVIAVSRNLGGELLAFSASGRLFGTVHTQEILSIQLADLDQDGVDELLTEEVETRGTGIFATTFDAYRVGGPSIRRLWSGRAYEEMDLPPAPREEREGFLRIGIAERAGAYAPELIHAVFDANSRVWSMETLVLRGDRFEKK